MAEEVTAARAAAQGVATARRTVDPFGFLSVSDDPALQRVVAQRYAATHSTTVQTAPARDRVARRLRLGFVSTDFCEHPVGRLIVGLFEHLDRERFAVTAYAIGERQEDAIRRRLRSAVDAFAVSPRLDATALAGQIADDRIDILFDLGGYSGVPILDLLARRPAPMQVNFLGYTGTLGMPACDFIACDTYCIAPSAALHYTERPLPVAPCYLPSDPARGNGARPQLTRADYGLNDDAIVVCAFTNTGKIAPPWFAATMRILGAAPRTVLWLRQPAADAMERLRAHARAAGVAGERIVFAPADPLDRYQARFALADFMLDSWPYGSHTTVNDALFAGLPVLTLAGRSFAGRASASQLAVLGLASLIASDVDDGVARAIALAQDAHTRRRTRDRLADPNVRAALFDMDRYARHFEGALRAAWAA
jgi:predicted O-linked N-acetylglucosamine transferase (SPINDLY family)